MDYTDALLTESQKFLELLAKEYPTIQAACTEVINLQAILNLPKGTEHFISDLHGEYEAFLHILKNASGVIKTKIDTIFGNTITESERRVLATLIYYPEEKLALIKSRTQDSMEDWYRITLYRLVEVCRVAASKYTRSKVRKALPKDFEYIIEELLHNDYSLNKEQYYEQIIRTIIAIGRADAFIIALSKLIQRLIIDRLHIIGDIFDRGPGAHIILDRLCSYHAVDIQWGNHDILWMGAAAGHDACIADVITNCIKYNNFDTLEDGYGINVRPLATFAMEVYGDNDCRSFMPRNLYHADSNPKEARRAAQIHKAIAVIQFKLEGQVILRHPEYGMDDRLLLRYVNFEKGTVEIDGESYPLNDTVFPTIDPKDPYKLTEQEAELVHQLRMSFLHSDKLQQHVKFLYKNGSMYLAYNGNLLFHGCIPMEPDGSFSTVNIGGMPRSGKAYIDHADKLVRQGYFARPDSPEKAEAMDFMWYLWCGPKSPLNGKNRITTFERYLIDRQSAWVETKDPYYSYINSEEMVAKILAEFGLNSPHSKVINGHMPVQINKGESPVKAGGRLLVIDGGLSKAYQPVTGIAGYTLIFNSYEMVLCAHEPFGSVRNAVTKEADIHSSPMIIEKLPRRMYIRDTDDGARIQARIADLEMLLAAYRKGIIKQSGL